MCEIDIHRLFAGVVQWQNIGFPSRLRGFDSLHLLHIIKSPENLDFFVYNIVFQNVKFLVICFCQSSQRLCLIWGFVKREIFNIFFDFICYSFCITSIGSKSIYFLDNSIFASNFVIAK